MSAVGVGETSIHPDDVRTVSNGVLLLPAASRLSPNRVYGERTASTDGFSIKRFQ